MPLSVAATSMAPSVVATTAQRIVMPRPPSRQAEGAMPMRSRLAS